MPRLLHIGFDNSSRLRRRIYYFSYKGIRFKLIQNHPHKWCDVLLTILPDGDVAQAQRAHALGAEFLSTLAWQNSSTVLIHNLGSVAALPRLTLRAAKCQMFDHATSVRPRLARGFDISPIPTVQDDHQRLALILWREAQSANKALFSLLLYWQILEIAGGNPVDWVNKTLRQSPRIRGDLAAYVAKLPLAGRALGNYLLDDCRHAIAHIRRKPGRTTLRFDDGEENRRIQISTRVAARLAAHYVRSNLRLTDVMHLVRERRGGFPVYVSAASMTRPLFQSAYSSWSPPGTLGLGGRGRPVGPSRRPKARAT